MIELLFLCVVSAKQPSNPPPQPLPAKIVANLPPKEQTVKKEKSNDYWPGKKKSDSSLQNGKKLQKEGGAKTGGKRQYNRRGIRGSRVAFDTEA